MKTLAQTLTGRDKATLRDALPALRKVLNHAEYNSFAAFLSEVRGGDNGVTIGAIRDQLAGATAFIDLCHTISAENLKQE